MSFNLNTYFVLIVSYTCVQNILREVVAAVAEAGLIPLALVCDQGSAFQSVIKNLKDETRWMQIISNSNIGK